MFPSHAQRSTRLTWSHRDDNGFRREEQEEREREEQLREREESERCLDGMHV